MTAVASPPSFPNFNHQPAWGVDGGQTLNTMNPDDLRGMLPPRKPAQRSNSSSSMSSSSSSSSTGTLTSAPPQTNGHITSPVGEMNGWSNGPTPRKRPQPKAQPQWAAPKPDNPSADIVRMLAGRPAAPNGANPSSLHQPPPLAGTPGHMMGPQNGLPRQGVEIVAPSGQAVLYLLSLNGTFERKTISVPFYPDTLRIGRQTNAKTLPTPINGFFDSKVLSRQHAEVWAERSGKIWIRDVKSSNGTFVNGTRLSPENRESEPHELQAQDHLELGIDIVSEDQKTVVHHKVAAKVEHAGFASPANGLLDVGLVDLDPSALSAGLPPRARAGSQASNGRLPPTAAAAMAGGAQPNGMAHQRQLYFNPVTTENIVKRLHNEMRNARLQSQDLTRTGQFIHSLLSKDDVKNQDRDAHDPPRHPIANGGALSFRSDGGKTRFSEPPAPPPSQPLPEKPDVAKHGPDVPGLKRGVTERPKSQPPNHTSPSGTSPGGGHNMSQILQLTEALNTAKKEIDNHSARVRELEEMFQKEREARLEAEDMVQKMGETSHAKANGSAVLPNGHSELDRAFDPSLEKTSPTKPDSASDAAPPSQPDRVEAAAAVFQAQIDSMVTEMKGLKEQLESYKLRATRAETERDASNKSLAELVLQIQKRDEEESRRSARHRSRPASKSRSRPRSSGSPGRRRESTKAASFAANGKPVESSHNNQPRSPDDAADVPTLSRANTITPSTGGLEKPAHDQALIQGLPYASMISVVLIGMGLMAYINGWQAQPRLGR